MTQTLQLGSLLQAALLIYTASIRAGALMVMMSHAQNRVFRDVMGVESRLDGTAESSPCSPFLESSRWTEETEPANADQMRPG